jgi:hypothetical protein
VTRVYLPTTLGGLATAQLDGVLTPPMAAHAVTAAVREWYIEGDLEELEYVAFTEAAEASLRMLAAAPEVARRRVVIAVDVPDVAVSATQHPRFRSAVLVSAQVSVSAVASVHVDEDVAEPVVQQAIAALPAADEGDDDARFTLDEAEATELLWYDVSEIGDLI